MQKICDICGEKCAELFDRTIINNQEVCYGYCNDCYQSAVRAGKVPSEVAHARAQRRGLECPKCKHTVEEYKRTMLLGCADCYVNMRDVALDGALSMQSIFPNDFNLKHTYPNRQNQPVSIMASGEVESTQKYNSDERFLNYDDSERAPKYENCEYGKKRGDDDRIPKSDVRDHTLKSADKCTLRELVECNVMSSRIRFARNIRGLQFPKYIQLTDNRVVDLINGCQKASVGVFDGRVLLMSKLSKAEKCALIERHIISLPLANNTQNGAVIAEGSGTFGGMSVMVNEEDHIREQCINVGFDLVGAYKRICEYDEALLKILPIAYDEQFGFLTACPSNLGTGMRASVMLFLPALKRAGAIGDALKTFKNSFGLTIRGVFGEGSDAVYDMYQISNSKTLCVSEKETIEQLEQAVVRMCYCERVALEKLVREQNTQLLDRISRSYGVLKSAYSITAQELSSLLVDVKIGVILGILPIKTTRPLDEMIWACTPSSLQIITGGNDVEECNKTRAKIVRKILAEEE